MDLLKRLVKEHGIGLTGGVATGKSTVARLIAAAGRVVVDADQLSRETTRPGSPGLAALVAAFGADILDPSGALDRKKLGRIVFADAAERSRLEAITHPLIRASLYDKLVEAAIDRAPRVFFYEAALLFEAGRKDEFRAVWATWCPRETQLARLMARNALAREDAERILAAQMPADEKAKRADLVIDTSGDMESVKAQVEKALATSPT